MRIDCLVVGILHTNCYVISEEDTNNCVVIDPGASGDKIIDFLDNRSLNPVKVLITHGHNDHIRAIIDLKAHYNNLEVICHKDAEEYLKMPELNLSCMSRKLVSVMPDKLIEEGDDIVVNKIVFNTFLVPGHADGSICYYLKDNNCVFTGDTLFKDTIGITDNIPRGNMKILVSNIKKKLMTLPDDTIVYPGHGPETTIAYEKKNNYFINN